MKIDFSEYEYKLIYSCAKAMLEGKRFAMPLAFKEDIEIILNKIKGEHDRGKKDN